MVNPVIYVLIAIVTGIAGFILGYGYTGLLNFDQEIIVAASAVIVALVALCVALWQAYLQREAIRLEIFENAFRDIRDRESVFTERYMVPLADLDARLHQEQDDIQAAKDSQAIPGRIHSLSGVRHVTAFELFNTIEYLAFLINNRFVGDRRLENFFRGAFVYWYEELFQKHDSEAEQDPMQYDEFKKLYKKLKGREP